MKKKTNVKYTNVKYEFDENKKSVKCILDYDIDLSKYPFNEMFLTFEFLTSALKNCNISGLYLDKSLSFNVEMQTIGTATCHDDDEYDETIGKQIALTRAQAKAFENTCKVYDAICTKLDAVINEGIRYINNCWDSANRCWQHVLDIDDCGIVITNRMNNINKIEA